MPIIMYDDGTTRGTSPGEAARIVGDLLQQLITIQGVVAIVMITNPEIDRDFIKSALSDKYPDEHRLRSNAGRLWHAMCKAKGSNKQSSTLSAMEILSMKEKIIEGRIRWVGPVIKSDYSLLYAAIAYKLTIG